MYCRFRFLVCLAGVAATSCFWPLRKPCKAPVRIQWEQAESAFVRLVDEKGKLLIGQWLTAGRHDTVLALCSPCNSLRMSVTRLTFGKPKPVGKFGNAEGMLVSPRGIRWNRLPGYRSKWAVVDAGNRRIVWVDTSGGVETWFEDTGRFQEPVDLAIGVHRDVWVCDRRAAALFHYDHRGSFVEDMRGWKQAELLQPVALDLDEYGRLLVLDRKAHCLFEMDPMAREKVQEYCILGWGKGFLRSPTAMRVGNGSYMVADAANRRLVEFPLDRSPARAFESGTVTALAPLEGMGWIVHFAGENGLWVVGHSGQRVQKIKVDINSAGGISVGNGVLAVTGPAESRIVFVEMKRQVAEIDYECTAVDNSSFTPAQARTALPHSQP